MINCVIRNQIQEAFKRAEIINVRGEVSIPLCKLKVELDKRRIAKSHFMEYLKTYSSPDTAAYIEYVSDILFVDETISAINREETFKITSGLC